MQFSSMAHELLIHVYDLIQYLMANEVLLAKHLNEYRDFEMKLLLPIAIPNRNNKSSIPAEKNKENA